MSILIKGMKMPNSCRECKLRDDMACCLPLDTPHEDRWVGKNEDKREPDCPLTELPYHGDLIDRDELHHNMKADAINKLSFFDDGYLHYLKGLEAVEDMLNDAPVIIPAERSEDGKT